MVKEVWICLSKNLVVEKHKRNWGIREVFEVSLAKLNKNRESDLKYQQFLSSFEQFNEGED